ncbi:VWA domain-containing protein [Opitutaceae bacterium TAV4]|nr:VWA domain-containing protein [Opitutaceae bacterium TAV4]RRJ99195.1 VWA domain-containing protein [Opitutaceae bacterium TAV3]
MPYSADISRATPTCFLFVVDQSGSMDETMENGGTKAQFVADVLNKTLFQLVINCKKSGEVRHYFDIGVIAYSGTSARSGFSGALESGILQPVSSIEANPLRIEDRVKTVPDGAGGFIEQPFKFPVWFDPISNGGTPTAEAFKMAAEVLVEWCDAHPASYPPTVIHVTDGQFTSEDPKPIADAIRQISTNDGTALLFNLHVDSRSGAEVAFPATDANLDDYGKQLFAMSSQFPPHLIEKAKALDYVVNSECRFFGYRAGYRDISNFFKIGTQASNMR